MAPLRIGIVDLCTSHPQKFVPILRELGAEVVAVWDSGETRDASFDLEFAAQFAIPRVCATLEEMVPLVDAVTVHGADWDRHLERVRPFVEAGKWVCLDKPMVGSVADVERLIELDRRCPGRIFGGSSCQFVEEVLRMRDQWSADDPLVTALATGPNDLFSYGIHTVEMLQAAVGYDAEAVTCLRDAPLGNYVIHFARGFEAHLHLHAPHHEWFLLVHTMDKGVRSTGIDASKLYGAFLRRFMDFVGGEPGGWCLADALQPILVAIAMHEASAAPGQAVRLDQLQPEDGFEGQAFAQAYREARDRGENLYTVLKQQRWATSLPL